MVKTRKGRGTCQYIDQDNPDSRVLRIYQVIFFSHRSQQKTRKTIASSTKNKVRKRKKKKKKKKLPLRLKVPTDSLGIGSPGMSHSRFRLGHGRRAHALSPGSNLSLLLGATGANSRAPRLFITAATITTATTTHAIRKTFISPTVSSSSPTSLSIHRRTTSPLRPFTTATASTHRTMSSATSFYDFKPLDSMPHHHHHHHHSTCTLSSLASSLPPLHPSPISCHGSIRH